MKGRIAITILLGMTQKKKEISGAFAKISDFNAKKTISKQGDFEDAQ